MKKICEVLSEAGKEINEINRQISVLKAKRQEIMTKIDKDLLNHDGQQEADHRASDHLLENKSK